MVAYLLMLRCGGRRGWFWPGRDMPSQREKCGRRGRYPLDRLIESYGINAKLFEWSNEITGDCPRKRSGNLDDQRGARCPDLPKVVWRGSGSPRPGVEGRV